jgi:ABC-type dipeptide/oligopeptide/nickel transport system permease component
MRLLRFAIRRLAGMVLLLAIVSALTFWLVASMPGDPIRMSLAKHATPDTLRQLDHEYGLDQPVWRRYLTYMGGVLHGNLGLSLVQPGTSVNDLLAEGIPVSLALGGLSLLVALLVGVPLGVLAAVRQNRPLADHLSMGVMLVLWAAPAVVLIPLLVSVFAVRLGWLPASGWGDDGWLGVKEAILPVTVYAAGIAAYFARSMRSFMLEVLRQDYMRTARAKGLPRRRVLYRHALKNTLLPFASVLGPTLVFLVTGSFIVESQFSIPGVGAYTVQATLDGDYAVVDPRVVL